MVETCLPPLVLDAEPGEGAIYEALVENMSDAVLVTNREGTIVRVNGAAIELFGYAREDLLGQPTENLLPERFRSDHRNNRVGYLGDPQSRPMGSGSQVICLHKSGREFPVDIGLAPIRLPSGSYLAVTLRDVSEREREREQISELATIYESIFDSEIAIIENDFAALLVQIQELRADGVTDLAQYLRENPDREQTLIGLFGVNAANPAALRLIGADSAVDLVASKRLAPGNLDPSARAGTAAVIWNIMMAMWEGKTYLRTGFETNPGKPDSRSLIFSIRLPRSLKNAHRVPAVLTDVTDVKVAEAERKASAAKSQFLAKMSHEIRTPLNGVVGNIELLQDTALSADQISLVNSVRSSADTLLHLIGDILDFSKIEAGKTELEQITFRLPDILLDLDAMFRPRADSEGLAFVWRIHAAAPERIVGDPLRLKQVLINLVGNAMRYTKEGGIFIRLTSSPEVDGRTTLRFDVIDSGAGLDPATAARLFNPFEQADASTTRIHGGTGLGLAICKSLVDLWDGEIGVDGTVGLGAHFWFTMPAQVAERARVVSMEQLRANGSLGQQTYLYLPSADREDQAFRESWEREGIRYTVASDLNHLLQLCDAAPPPTAFATTTCVIQEPAAGPIPAVARACGAEVRRHPPDSRRRHAKLSTCHAGGFCHVQAAHHRGGDRHSNRAAGL